MLSNAESWEIRSLLAEATRQLTATTVSPALDAEVLLAWVLGKDRSYLRAWHDRALKDEEFEQFSSMIKARVQGIPVAYLIGSREFWSRDFIVGPGVLIPRADTELLIELALKLMPPDRVLDVIDLGTGSGIIAITLAAERPLAKLTATDKSAPALAIAKQNAEKHQVDNVSFLRSDWFDNVPADQFDLILSNPPYIAESDPHLSEGDLRFEPKSALVADEDGLKDIKAIASAALDYLKTKGHLLLEHGYAQAAEVQAILKDLGYHDIETYPDLAGHPRVTVGRKV